MNNTNLPLNTNDPPPPPPALPDRINVGQRPTGQSNGTGMVNLCECMEREGERGERGRGREERGRESFSPAICLSEMKMKQYTHMPYIQYNILSRLSVMQMVGGVVSLV